MINVLTLQFLVNHQQEELYRIMQLESRHGTRVLQGLLDHNQNNYFQGEQIEQKLQEKLNLMETQYAKMEAEYFKKIKDLKMHLAERTRKQISLSGEVSQLKGQFKEHQEQISKVTEQLLKEKEKGKSIEPKQPKKSSPPGLLKKSLQTQKKIQKRNSPTAHTMNTISNNDNSRDLNFSGENVPMSSKNITQPKTLIQSKTSLLPKKGYSPTAVAPSLTTTITAKAAKHYLNLISKEATIQEKPRVEMKEQKQEKKDKQLKKDDAKILQSPIDMHGNPQKSPPQKKKAYSPKGNAQLKSFLVNSMKKMEANQKKPAMPTMPTNASPKRVIRYSPTANSGNGSTLFKKVEPKKVLGNLKQTMEAF